MKRTFTLLIFSVILFSCKKETAPHGDDFVQRVKTSLRDSLSVADYSNLDFSRVVVNRVDSVNLFVVRIPFMGDILRNHFVIVRTTGNGKLLRGKIVHLDGSEIEVGEGKVKRRVFEGSVSISSLDHREVLSSAIHNGYMAALHPQMNTREQGTEPVYPVNVMPEVVVVAYVHSGGGIDFSTWLRLTSFFYNNDTGTSSIAGGDYGSYYGSLDGGGGGSYGDTGGGGSGETIAVDIESYVDNPAINVDQYLKCFDNIPDDGATCSITIYADIPVDSDPSKYFNWNTESPGHCFLELKKTNGTQSVQQSIGFYPATNWKNILNADPVDSKMVDNGHHEFNAALKMNVNPYLFKMAIGKIKELSTMKYDMDEFNCTDFALEVFNYVRTPLQIPQYVIPGGTQASNMPQGLYIKLQDMWLNNDPEKNNIIIDILKGYVGGSSGPCN